MLGPEQASMERRAREADKALLLLCKQEELKLPADNAAAGSKQRTRLKRCLIMLILLMLSAGATPTITCQRNNGF